jgi:hypothetical protein
MCQTIRWRIDKRKPGIYVIHTDAYGTGTAGCSSAKLEFRHAAIYPRRSRDADGDPGDDNSRCQRIAQSPRSALFTGARQLRSSARSPCRARLQSEATRQEPKGWRHHSGPAPLTAAKADRFKHRISTSDFD